MKKIFVTLVELLDNNPDADLTGRFIYYTGRSRDFEYRGKIEFYSEGSWMYDFEDSSEYLEVDIFDHYVEIDCTPHYI